MAEPISIAVVVVTALGLGGGGFALGLDLFKALYPKFYPMGMKEFLLGASTESFFKVLEATVESPPVNLTYPLNCCKWKISKRESNRCEILLTRVEHGPKHHCTLLLRIVWLIEEQTAAPGKPGAKPSKTVRIEFYSNTTPPGSSAEQLAFQICSLTQTIVTGLNNQLAAGKTGPVRSPAQSGYTRFWSARSASLTSPAELDCAATPDSRTLHWPSAQDYNECLQNPGSAFLDFDLSYGTADLNALGLPKAVTGNFASVYRIKCHNIDFAVRCFLRPIKDLEYRYKILARYICSDDLKYTVDLEYLPEGVRVGEQSYPVLKMEWVDGLTLDRYIESLLSGRNSLTLVQNKFRKMCQELYDAGIAHGDLQHGNIIVREDELFLVDYDGMFVPDLASVETSHELGHPNYQHPDRSSNHFGPYLDNFSAFVIDTSLMALASSPELWGKLNGGDDCLLFRSKDFLSPATSEIFDALSNHQDPQLVERASLLRSFLCQDLRSIPALGLNGQPLPWRQDCPPRKQSWPEVPRSSNLPSLLSGHSDWG